MSRTIPQLTFLPDFEGRDVLYQPLDPEKKEIRIVEIEHNEDRTAPLKGALKTVSITGGKGAHHYCAISYHWGSTAEPKSITLFDGNQTEPPSQAHEVPISQNLDGALRQFRENAIRKKEKLVLWTDAVCINQLDTDERSQQVTIMKSIFAAATEVWAWLGDSNPEAHVGFMNFAAILGHCDLEGPDQLKQLFVDEAKKGPKDSILLRSLAAFSSLVYWNRGWIIQEISTNPSVRYHHRGLSTRPLSIRVIQRALERFNDYLRSSPEVLPLYFGAMRYILQMFFVNFQRPGANLEPLFVKSMSVRLILTRSTWHTTDPRDRVYALVGVVPCLYSVVPDYSLSIEDCFSQASYNVLSDCQNWSLQCFFSPARSPFLPSWALDFTTLHELGHPTAPLFNASHDRELYYSTRDAKFRTQLSDNDTLLTAGFKLDKVLAVATYGPDKTRKERLVQDTLGKVLVSCSRLFWQRHVLIDGDGEIALPTPEERYSRRGFKVLPSSEDRALHLYLRFEMRRILFRVLYADGISDTAIENLASGPETGRIQIEDAGRLETSLRFYQLFITQSGYVGLASRGVAPRDIIALFPTGTHPFLIRKVGTRQINGTRHAAHILLGACYVEGIMHGEAVDEEASRVYKKIHGHDWDGSERIDPNLAFRKDICLV